MKFTAQMNYPSATPDAVFALLVDADFRGEVCEATHALDYDVGIEVHHNGAASVRVHRVMPAEVPDFVRRLVGDRIDVVQTEEWRPPRADGRRTADLLVQIRGQPARVTGAVTLERDGSGVRESIQGELKVSIPMVGRKVEPEIAKGILYAIRKEEERGRVRLRVS